MRIEQAGVGFESNFKPKSIDFSIGDPTMIIYLLRNKLYSDKLRVFLQEYISNGRDANREVGAPDHELDITYPTKTEPLFKVRDYGPGLSTERVQNVFTVFGASTKRATDQFIGGFGIGAKSAWAYTDSFVVTSYHKGTESQYLCHIGTTQKGSADLIHEAKTDQKNGVEIQVQVKEEDISRAQELIRELTILWPEKPRYINDPRLNFKRGDSGFEDPIPHMPFKVYRYFRPQLSNFGGHYISVDGIPYPFEDDYIQKLLYSFSLNGKPYRNSYGGINHEDRNGSIFVFEAKTGEVDVAASREQVEINDKFKEFKQKIRLQLIEALEKNYRDAAAKGADEFFNFVQEDYLSRLRPSTERAKQQNIQSPAPSKREETIVQTLYNEAIAACRKQLKKKADPLINNLTALEGTRHYCFWFSEIKSFIVDGTIFPYDLLDTEYIYRDRGHDGFLSRRKETFCATAKMSDKAGQGLNPRHYAYNPNDLTPERIKQLTRRVPREIHGILKTKDVPKYLKDLDCKPIEDVLVKPPPSYRSYSPARKAGSIRSIDTLRDGTLSFGSFQDAGTITQASDYVYAWTSEKSEWKPTIQPLFVRMHLNGFKFVQLNKKALKTLKEQFPTRQYVHWVDWEKEWRVGSKHFTPLEWNIFGLSWLEHSFPDIYSKFFRHEYSYGKGNNAALLAQIPEYKRIYDISIEIHQKAPKRDLFISKYGNGIKDLKKSEVYRARCEMLKKYPGLHFVEMTFADGRGDVSRDEFLEYFKNPIKFLKTFGKEFVGLNGWDKSNRL